jgi:hypothetical protein
MTRYERFVQSKETLAEFVAYVLQRRDAEGRNCKAEMLEWLDGEAPAAWFGEETPDGADNQ